MIRITFFVTPKIPIKGEEKVLFNMNFIMYKMNTMTKVINKVFSPVEFSSAVFSQLPFDFFEIFFGELALGKDKIFWSYSKFG